MDAQLKAQQRKLNRQARAKAAREKAEAANFEISEESDEEVVAVLNEIPVTEDQIESFRTHLTLDDMLYCFHGIKDYNIIIASTRFLEFQADEEIWRRKSSILYSSGVLKNLSLEARGLIREYIEETFMTYEQWISVVEQAKKMKMVNLMQFSLAQAVHEGYDVSRTINGRDSLLTLDKGSDSLYYSSELFIKHLDSALEMASIQTDYFSSISSEIISRFHSNKIFRKFQSFSNARELFGPWARFYRGQAGIEKGKWVNATQDAVAALCATSSVLPLPDVKKFLDGSTTTRINYPQSSIPRSEVHSLIASINATPMDCFFQESATKAAVLESALVFHEGADVVLVSDLLPEHKSFSFPRLSTLYRAVKKCKAVCIDIPYLAEKLKVVKSTGNKSLLQVITQISDMAKSIGFFVHIVGSHSNMTERLLGSTCTGYAMLHATSGLMYYEIVPNRSHKYSMFDRNCGTLTTRISNAVAAYNMAFQIRSDPTKAYLIKYLDSLVYDVQSVVIDIVLYCTSDPKNIKELAATINYFEYEEISSGDDNYDFKMVFSDDDDDEEPFSPIVAPKVPSDVFVPSAPIVNSISTSSAVSVSQEYCPLKEFYNDTMVMCDVCTFRGICLDSAEGMSEFIDDMCDNCRPFSVPVMKYYMGSLTYGNTRRYLREIVSRMDGGGFVKMDSTGNDPQGVD